MIRSTRDSERSGERDERSVNSGLANALFSTTQQRLFSLLFGQPDRIYLATELIRLAGVGRGTVQRELKRLTETGLITASRVGNQRHFKANPDSPLFNELCGIVRKTVGLVDPIRSALNRSGERIHLAILYGSVARGSDTAESDIDVLIVSDDITLEETYAILGPVESQLDRRVNPTVYTIEEFDRRLKDHNAFLSRIIDGEHVVLIGEIAAS